MTTHHHPMPFGAEISADGQVRFRLWAPAAKRVEVCLQQITLSMQVEPGGWFSCVTAMAKAGSRYHFRIDDMHDVPDPASRFQPDDVHGASVVVDPAAWRWRSDEWRGRPWEEAVIYELHIGAFTAPGNFAAVEKQLDSLQALGVTAIELMPVAEFPGRRNWGYDGVYLFAPESSYGGPEALKSLIDAAHTRGLMVLLDVVYNHFGPEGNYLHLYAPQFFTERHLTPWGASINYDGEAARWVRQFFIHNALYWLEEYQFDGLRLDAVHAVFDESQPDILIELAGCVNERFGDDRHIHLLLENDNNAARYLTRGYAAQWNDDIHHALHLLLTGERESYYCDYADDPVQHLGRCLSEGFAYQGEPSSYRKGQRRGEISTHLPPTAFITFLQNHDQIGNRAFGERITLLADAAQIRAATALLLLAPSIPLLFMGQEWGSRQPFPFFCDFGAEFAAGVVAGRRRELGPIPDPMAEATFIQAVLDWDASQQPVSQQWLVLHRELLALRRSELTPRLRNTVVASPRFTRLGERAFSVCWRLGDGARLTLFANLGDEPQSNITLPCESLIYTTHDEVKETLPPWSVLWYLDEQ
jgi:1,4-alpha-glucan branching enzyme/maltooligosyltrehalose trehalohydrolase